MLVSTTTVIHSLQLYGVMYYSYNTMKGRRVALNKCAPAAPGAAPAGPAALLVMAAILYVSSAAGQRTSHPGRSASLHSTQGTARHTAQQGLKSDTHARHSTYSAAQRTSHPGRSTSLHSAADIAAGWRSGCCQPASSLVSATAQQAHATSAVQLASQPAQELLCLQQRGRARRHSVSQCMPWHLDTRNRGHAIARHMKLPALTNNINN